MKLITVTAEINKAIESIAKRGQKLDNDIQLVGVSVLEHIALHGDTTLLDKLVSAMPKGARKGAFCEWAVHHGQVRMLDRNDQADALAIEQGRLFKKDKSKEWNVEDAFTSKWWDFKPEADLLTTFDAAKMVNALLKKYSKAVKDGAQITGQADALSALRAFTQTLETEAETL